jgi:ElaB/YqjD/DUF883 family membrane-anchored ribosome-binding protein
MDEATNKISSASWDEPATTSGSAEDYDENTEQLRADIEDTRAEMSQTINEIQERLSPEHLMGQVKETVREATIGKVERVMDKVGETISEMTEPAREVAGRAGTVIKDSVWKNPIPIAMIGLGVGMLFMRRYRDGDGYSTTSGTPRTRRYYGMGQKGYGRSLAQTQGTQSTAGTEGALDQAWETAGDLAGRSTDALNNLGSKARESASVVSSRFSQMLRENPLAVGAVAVAAGTAVGLVLPSTRFESEYISETSERLVDKAQEVARGALDKVQDAAKQMTAPEGQQQPGQQQQPGKQQPQAGS